MDSGGAYLCSITSKVVYSYDIVCNKVQSLTLLVTMTVQLIITRLALRKERRKRGQKEDIVV